MSVFIKKSKSKEIRFHQFFTKKSLSNLKLSDFCNKMGERILTCTFLNYVIINLVN